MYFLGSVVMCGRSAAVAKCRRRRVVANELTIGREREEMVPACRHEAEIE